MATYGQFLIHLKDTVYENMLMTCRAGLANAKQSISLFPSFPLKHERVGIWFIGVLLCRFKWACAIRITEGCIFSSVVHMRKPSSPQSHCLPTKSDLLLSYPDVQRLTFSPEAFILSHILTPLQPQFAQNLADWGAFMQISAPKT